MQSKNAGSQTLPTSCARTQPTPGGEPERNERGAGGRAALAPTQVSRSGHRRPDPSRAHAACDDGSGSDRLAGFGTSWRALDLELAEARVDFRRLSTYRVMCELVFFKETGVYTICRRR